MPKDTQITITFDQLAKFGAVISYAALMNIRPIPPEQSKEVYEKLLLDFAHQKDDPITAAEDLFSKMIE